MYTSKNTQNFILYKNFNLVHAVKLFINQVQEKSLFYKSL